jgi:hypothetical protein
MGSPPVPTQPAPVAPQPAIVQDAPQPQPAVVEEVAPPSAGTPQQHQASVPPPQQASAQPPYGQQQAYGQQPAYQAQPSPYAQPADAYGATYGQPGVQKVASAYYVAIVALVFAFLGGLLGMILALVAGWLAKKQAAQGYAKTQQAIQISNLAFIIAMVVFIIVINL